MQICKFNTRFLCQELGLEDLVELFCAATGVDIDKKSMEDAADRIWNLERAFIVREGITKKDDCLIGPWGEDPVPTGPFKGERIDPKKFQEMLEEYYEIRGWDKDTGIPILGTKIHSVTTCRKGKLWSKAEALAGVHPLGKV